MKRRSTMDVKPQRATFLTRLALENVKSFAGEHVLDLTDENGNPARWTLILGDNGVGKTTLLECLAHLAPGFNSEDETGAKDLRSYVEPRIAPAENPVIYSLGRDGVTSGRTLADVMEEVEQGAAAMPDRAAEVGVIRRWLEDESEA